MFDSFMIDLAKLTSAAEKTLLQRELAATADPNRLTLLRQDSFTEYIYALAYKNALDRVNKMISRAVVADQLGIPPRDPEARSH